MRVGTLNVGRMTGKGRELTDVMPRRKVYVLCAYETWWKDSKARSIGARFKLYYQDVDRKRTRVGVILKEEFTKNVVKVKRESNKVMSVKLENKSMMVNIISGYAQQVGCEMKEKEKFKLGAD